jgi:MerR family transcriptional regulator, light-induced transcriptional regulator
VSAVDHGFTIREIAAGSGVSEGTLRMWEARHGFPAPYRLASGHRRYSKADLEQIRSVVRARGEGLSLSAAIERVRRLDQRPPPSVYRALRTQFPELQSHLLPKPLLVDLTHAIEDECALRAQRPLLCGCFQHERFYRQAQGRWRELSRTAERALVFADFPATRQPDDGPTEVRLGAADALTREWVIVCDATDYAACLAGWERPREPGLERRFETVWTVDPAVAREAARVLCALAAREVPDQVAGLADYLGGTPGAGRDRLQAAMDLATRMVLYATGAGR